MRPLTWPGKRYLEKWVDYLYNQQKDPSNVTLREFLADPSPDQEVPWTIRTAKQVGKIVKDFTEYYCNTELTVIIPLHLDNKERGKDISKKDFASL